MSQAALSIPAESGPQENQLNLEPDYIQARPYRDHGQPVLRSSEAAAQEEVLPQTPAATGQSNLRFADDK